jgi:hypothetical protein
VFSITTGWLEVAVEPSDAVKESDVEVVTDRMAGFTTFTVIEALEVLLLVSCESAMRVDEPSEAVVVSHETEYCVPDATVEEPMRFEGEMLAR